MTSKPLVSIFLFAALLGVMMPGCTDPNGWKKVDVSKETANFSIQRFDRDFFAMDTNHLQESEAKLRAQYGSFYNYYILGIMKFGKAPNPMDTTKRAL